MHLQVVMDLIMQCIFQSYCLKVKEMDDEEYSYEALQEPLYRLETGNYEYRLVFIHTLSDTDDL